MMYLEADLRRQDEKTRAIEEAMRDRNKTAEEDAAFAEQMQPGGTLYEQAVQFEASRDKGVDPPRLHSIRRRGAPE